MIKDLIAADAFNSYCVDCLDAQSTMFNVTFGVFICSNCAKTHWHSFDMGKSYVKSCFTENWDKHQLKMATMYGNKPFFEFMKCYKLERTKIEVKYRTVAAKYYRDRVNAEVADQPFERDIPTRSEGGMSKRALQAKMAGLNFSNHIVQKGDKQSNTNTAKH